MNTESEIDRLEKILNSEDPTPVRITPDGKVVPMHPDTFEDYLVRAESAGAIDFHLRVMRTPEGSLDFYIHPQDKDGETGDFKVSGAFVVKLENGAGSSRPSSPPLVGS